MFSFQFDLAIYQSDTVIVLAVAETAKLLR